MDLSLTWLPEAIQPTGLTIIENPGWQDRGAHGQDMGKLWGVLCHHTAGPRTGDMSSMGELLTGRAGISPPLAHIGLGRSGTVYLLAAGYANHAGAGQWPGLPVNNGNPHLIGIEAENMGTPDDPWPDVQYRAYVKLVAAILKHLGFDETHCIGHKEYAPGRKTDPSLDMDAFREAVKGQLSG